MDLIRATFSENIRRTPTVESFRFFPQGKIDFIPGQFLQIVFDGKNPQNKELNKYLSFSSSPSKSYIEVTKRLSESLFSQRLKDLKADDPVFIKAPMGLCVYKEEYKRIAFLIGGIGITPVISMLGHIADNGLGTDVLLLYSNRNEEEIAFKPELDLWKQNNKNIRSLYLVSECEPKSKDCLSGRIDKELLTAQAKDLGERTVFIFGPPKMVEAMKALCLEMNCSEENIKSESFLGY